MQRHRRSLFLFLSVERAKDAVTAAIEGRRASARRRKAEEIEKAVKTAIEKREKMFYSLTLEKELELQPRFFGPRMREVLQQKLISEVREDFRTEGGRNQERDKAF